jgi:hypothetical protein
MQFPKCRSPFFLWTSGGLRFVETGKISPADFYMIIIWKANRAKTRKKASGHPLRHSHILRIGGGAVSRDLFQRLVAGYGGYLMRRASGLG